MNVRETKSLSKFLSLVLRHRPDAIGIELDESGWVAVDELLVAMQRSGRSVTREQLDRVVANNDKQRFSISDDRLRIRANQGHSVDVQLGYESAEPPDLLYHGTPVSSLDQIRCEGLKKMQRHHVHLHLDRDTSLTVGRRRGKAALLVVRAKAMHESGYTFFVTPNDVWLTNEVPASFIDFPVPDPN